MTDPRTEGSVRWTVAGRVQGVGFRWYVREAAERLGIVGDVRNLPDGRVEIRASAPADRLAELLEAVRCGPRGSRVERVDVDTLAPARFDGFRIRG